MTDVIISISFQCITHFVRAIAVTGAIFLILRSIAGKFAPLGIQNIFQPLYRITEVFVIPLRQILPESVCSKEMDYSALLSAIIVLLTGLGIEQLLESITHYLL